MHQRSVNIFFNGNDGHDNFLLKYNTGFKQHIADRAVQGTFYEQMVAFIQFRILELYYQNF